MTTRTMHLGLQDRSFHLETINEEARTVDVVFTTGAAVLRQRWAGWDRAIPFEEILVVSESAINMERLAAGAPVLESHRSYSTESQVGVVDKAWIEDGKGHATLRFPSEGTSAAADKLWSLVSQEIVRNVSVGYSIDKVEVREAVKKGDVEQRRVTRWTPYEISFVTMPADPGAQTRADQNLYPVEIETKETTVPDVENPNPTGAESRAADLSAAVLAAERRRAADIMALARRAGIADDIADKAVTDGTLIDAFRAAVLDAIAPAEPARRIASASTSPIQIINPGESPTEWRAAIVDGMVMRALGRASEGKHAARNQERAREFAGMSLLSVGAELLEIRKHFRMSPSALYDEIVKRSMLAGSDYPLLLQDAANKFLLMQYEYQQPSYRYFSAQRTFNDFKAHKFLRIGDFPNLLQVSETGEITSGSFSENREQVTAVTYGRTVRLSRQMMVNDDLSAFSDLTGMAGRRISDFENQLAWAVIQLNSNAGPAMSDTGNLWNSAAVNTTGGHSNLATAATGITLAGLNTARQSMRTKRSLDNIPLNLDPKFIVTGPAKQTELEQLLSVNLLATQLNNVNVFNGQGMTKLTPVIDGYITDNAWYLFADPKAAPTFVWGYVSGFEGPRFAIDQPFNQDGLALKVMEDFGFGAVDWRPTYRNPGA
jgi:hypothetical protein